MGGEEPAGGRQPHGIEQLADRGPTIFPVGFAAYVERLAHQLLHGEPG
jgi:hypothetical protein